MGHKKTRRELIETTRNEAARHYHQQLHYLEQMLAKANATIHEQNTTAMCLTRENDSLKMTIARKDEVISRLSALLGKTESERQQILQGYETYIEYIKKVNHLSDLNRRLSALFF